MKNLRIENEYYQRQLENLRKEVELAKAKQPRTRSLDRNSAASKENCNAHFGGNLDFNMTSSAYEPASSLLQPMPHPRPVAPSMYEMMSDE